MVDYLRTYPEKIAEWKAADKKKRIALFGPGKIRTALDARDGYTSGARKKTYDLISEAASHTSYRGFNLFMNDQNLGEICPFFNEKKLEVWVGQTASRLSHAAVILVSSVEGLDLGLLSARAEYLDVVNGWRLKYSVK